MTSAIEKVVDALVAQGPIGVVALMLAAALSIIYVDQRFERRRRDEEHVGVIRENTEAMTSLRTAVLIQNTSREELKASIVLNASETRALKETVDRAASDRSSQLDRIERILDQRS